MIEILNIIIQNIVFIFLSCCGVYSLLTFKNKKLNISYEIIISILLNNFLFSLLRIISIVCSIGGFFSFSISSGKELHIMNPSSDNKSYIIPAT